MQTLHSIVRPSLLTNLTWMLELWRSARESKNGHSTNQHILIQNEPWISQRISVVTVSHKHNQRKRAGLHKIDLLSTDETWNIFHNCLFSFSFLVWPRMLSIFDWKSEIDWWMRFACCCCWFHLFVSNRVCRVRSERVITAPCARALLPGTPGRLGDSTHFFICLSNSMFSQGLTCFRHSVFQLFRRVSRQKSVIEERRFGLPVKAQHPPFHDSKSIGELKIPIKQLCVRV